MREYYFSLSSTPGILFLWKPAWRSKIPPRVAFFSWTASLGKILTIDNLWNRGDTVVDWHFMCKRSGESVEFVWSSMGYASVTDLFSTWQGPFGKHRNIVFWSVVPHCVLWCLWQERNVRCPEEMNGLSSRLNLFFFTLFWIGVLLLIFSLFKFIRFVRPL